MRVNPQIVPLAFWIGFLALGFATAHSGGRQTHGMSPAAASIHDKQTTPAIRAAARQETTASD